MQITIEPIGIITSCFKEKFGIPRQPGLAPSTRANLNILPPFNRPEAFTGLEQCSHIWLEFIFHQSPTNWKPSVRPPRLGGNKRMGVFATRSPVRPNRLGLSVVKLERIDIDGSDIQLQLSGIDLVDGTPIIDIKPYIPYADKIDDAHNHFAQPLCEHLRVNLNNQSAEFCRNYQLQQHIDLQQLLTEILQQDPKPSYQQADSARRYGMRLLDLDIHWHYRCDNPDLCSNQAGDNQTKPNNWHIEVCQISYHNK